MGGGTNAVICLSGRDLLTPTDHVNLNVNVVVTMLKCEVK
jgi:hypothetical protein